MDPLVDVGVLLKELASVGFDPRQSLVVSFDLRFPDRPGWERGSDAASTSWQVSAYSRPDAYMLRLSRRTVLTERDLELLRTAVQEFADRYAAACESIAVEDVHTTSLWQQLSADQAELLDQAAASAGQAQDEFAEQQPGLGGNATA
jgi:hypothetical protein